MTDTTGPTSGGASPDAAPLPGPARRDRRSSWRHPSPLTLAPWLLVLITVAVHLALSVHMRTPIIHADEYGYLMGAHFMACGGVPTGKPFSPGYSLLLVPLWWATDSAATVYRGALDINTVLAGLTTLLLYRLARALAPTARPSVWVASAAVAAAFPSLLLYSDLAESENLLVPGFLLLCLLVLRAAERQAIGWWLAAAVDAGLLFWVHERAIVLSGTLLATAVAYLRPWRRSLRVLAAMAATLAAVLAAGAELNHWVTRPAPGRELPASGSTAGHILHQLTTAGGLSHLGTELAGQGLYLLAGAGALAVLGTGLLLSRRPWSLLGLRPRQALAAFLVLTVLGEAVLAAIYLATGSRVDDALYGRYVEVFAIPILLAGAVAGAGLAAPRQSRRTLAYLAAAVAALAVTAAGVALHWGRELSGPVVTANIFSISEVVRGTDARVAVAVVAGAGLAMVLVVLAGFRLSALGGAALAMAVWIPATAYGYSYLVDQSAGRLPQRSLPAAIVEIQQWTGSAECVSWDSSVDDAWTFYNTRLFAPAVAFPVFDSHRAGRLPCSSGLVVAGHDFGSNPRYPGAHLLLTEPSPEALWVMPGPLQRSLARRPLHLPQP